MKVETNEILLLGKPKIRNKTSQILLEIQKKEENSGDIFVEIPEKVIVRNHKREKNTWLTSDLRTEQRLIVAFLGTGRPWGIKSSSSFWMNIWLARFSLLIISKYWHEIFGILNVNLLTRFCNGWAATRSKIASFQDFFPHHTRRKKFLPKYWQTLSQILAYMQLLGVLPLHPNLKCFNFCSC